MLPCKNLPLIEMCCVAEVVSALTNAVSSPHFCTHQRSLTASTQDSQPRDFLWPKKRLSTSEERELVNSSPFTGQLKGVFHRLFQNSSVGLNSNYPHSNQLMNNSCCHFISFLVSLTPVPPSISRDAISKELLALKSFFSGRASGKPNLRHAGSQNTRIID